MKIHQHLLKLLFGNENMGMSWADNSIKNWGNLPISNPKPDLHNINAHSKFGENPLIFTRYRLEMKIQACHGQITPSKIDEICPLAITNQISIISMRKPNLAKIHWYLLKLLSRNKNTAGWTTDGWTEDACLDGYKLLCLFTHKVPLCV